MNGAFNVCRLVGYSNFLTGQTKRVQGHNYF